MLQKWSTLLLPCTLAADLIFHPNTQATSDKLVQLSAKLGEEEGLSSEILPVAGSSQRRYSLLTIDSSESSDDDDNDDSVSRSFAVQDHYLDDQTTFSEFLINAYHLKQVSLLNDDNFEHDTQAATGSTTGDWLVFFHQNEKCWKEIEPLVYSSSNLLDMERSHVIFGRVARDERSMKCFKRFNIEVDEDNCYQAIYISKSNVYYMASEKISSIESFVQGGYQKGDSKSVPVPPEIFDKRLQSSVFENLELMTALKIVATLIGLLGLLLKAKKTAPEKKAD